MKPIAAEKKPSKNTAIISEHQENKDSSIPGKQEPEVDDVKNPTDSKPVVPLPEQTGTVKYKKDYAVWY